MATRINEDGELEKYCPKCKEWWYADTEFFYASKSNTDGLHCWCKACFTEYDNIRKPRKGRPVYIHNPERNEEILSLHNSGESLRKIASKYNISFQAVDAIIKRLNNKNKIELH